jgi:hypothetical protein
MLLPVKSEWQGREAMPHPEDGTTAEPEMHPAAFAQEGLMTTPGDISLFTIELINA